MACPACGYRDNPAGANFCENCGAAVAPEQPPAGGGSLALLDPAGIVTVPLAGRTGDAPPVNGADLPTRPLAAAGPDLPTVPLTNGDQAPAAPAKPPAGDENTAATVRRSLDTEAAETVPLVMPDVSAGWTCACGQENPASETYCAGCGEARRTAVAPLTTGDQFAGFEITAQTDAQSFSVRPIDVAPAGTALLLFGDAAQLSESAATLKALGPEPAAASSAPSLVPRVLAEGTDPGRGTFLVSSMPDGDWTRALDGPNLAADQAAPVLDKLLLLAERAAAAHRLLLLSPASVTLSGVEVFVPRPIAPSLPLTGPLLAEPAYLPPELGANERDVAAWPANAYAAAATVQSLTGNALGFPLGWHDLMQRLLAADPANRPATRPEVLALLVAAAGAPPVTMHRTAFRTDIGHHHPVNQDAGGVWTWQRWDGTPVTLAVVADGVSAGTHSEDAAALAVTAIRSAIEQHWADREFTLERAVDLLLEAGMLAQEQICALPMQSDDDASATTLVAVCLMGGGAAGIWCGDSRAYGVTPEGMRQLTRDHSWVNIVVDSGEMKLAQAKADRRAHVIARWLGCSSPPRTDPGFDRFHCPLAAGDRLLVCSDGLYMYYDAPAGSDAELVETIYRYGEDAAGAVEEMVNTALARGGFDNITAVLVEVS